MKSLIFHFPRRRFHVYTVQKHKRANFLPLILVEASEVSWQADIRWRAIDVPLAAIVIVAWI
jgi:hypothetical protein